MGKSSKKKIRKKGLPPGTLVFTGTPNERDSSVQAFHYFQNYLQTYPSLPDTIPTEPKGVFWIDIRGLSNIALIEKLGNRFQIHPLALEDVVNTDQRPKLDEYDNGLFFILQNPKFDAQQFTWKKEQIAIFMGHDFVVSFQEDPDDTFQPIIQRLQNKSGRLRKKSADYTAYALLDLVVDQYYPILDDLEAQIEETEAHILTHGSSHTIKSKIFILKNLLSQFRKTILPLRELANRFTRTEKPFIMTENLIYYRDLTDHIIYLIDGADTLQSKVENLFLLHESDANHRLNNTMRLLAVISTIFMPLAFITGVYGMNFDYIPMLHNQWGFFILSGFMLFLAISMLLFFKKKNWM